MKLVSVIIPCYNCELYVEDAIRSIMNQTYSNLEILVINDGSSDNTKNILLKLSNEDKRVIYIENEVNLKLIETLNKGINIATGEYIARMDADDIAFADRIEKQISFLNKNPQVAMLGSAMDCFDDKGKKGIVYQPQSNEEIRSKMFVASPFNHPTVIFNMNILKKEDIHYDKKYYRAEDYGLWVDLMKKDNFIFANLSEPLLNYRILEDSETNLATKNLEAKNDVLVKIYTNLFNQFDLTLNPEEILQYVYSVDRNNFDKIKLNNLIQVYNKLCSYSKIKELKVSRLFSIRCLAIFIISPKTMFNLSFKTLFSFIKYLFVGCFFILKNKR